MRYFQFDEELAQGIVDGILLGYKEYLAVRREKKEELKISSAYAWVKGNHIDDSIARNIKEFGVKTNISKAGYAWGYLQFTYNDEKILFIIKNGMKSGSKLPSNRKNNMENNYLSKLAQINRNADFTPAKGEDIVSEQMSFDDFPIDDENLEKEITESTSKFDRFFIVSYTIDESKMIASIDLLLPNPHEMVVYRSASWSKYIDSSPIKIENDELQTVKGEKEPLLPNQSLYDYGIEDLREEKGKE
ncbi:MULTISPECIES: hypothetical protein [Clostridia]|uniref:spr1630 family ClpXP-sensitive toxin n=1 Tax=Clostridia TaxID=186801 RepID=UPI000EA0EE4E|nr:MULTISPECIES: hypothetical protein [Clostridia]NBJ68893.1 hypothetical protein [Roseburia sp. 1XD42-34]RKI80266.1 hypothetical protein D7V87_05295 [Clostridium sp. 1xD42-85]